MALVGVKEIKWHRRTTKRPSKTKMPLVEVEAMNAKFSKLDPVYYSKERCEYFCELISKINKLKKELNATILVHNYQRPEIFEIADYIGDSFGLSKKAAEETASTIVFCGVRFMAETAKILNPEKIVLLPNSAAGCPLAETAGAGEVRAKKEELRKKYSDLAVVGYVNTTAEVKAECDVCCTSANAVEIVRNLPSEHILFLPDKNLASYAQSQIPEKKIISWNGNCYVHQEITAQAIIKAKRAALSAKVLVHPECREEVIRLADAVCSTEGMIKYVRQTDASDFIIITERGLSDRLSLEFPKKRFHKLDMLCTQMKMTTLEDVLNSLEKMQYEINLFEDVAERARISLNRMLDFDAG